MIPFSLSEGFSSLLGRERSSSGMILPSVHAAVDEFKPPGRKAWRERGQSVHEKAEFSPYLVSQSAPPVTAFVPLSPKNSPQLVSAMSSQLLRGARQLRRSETQASTATTEAKSQILSGDISPPSSLQWAERPAPAMAPSPPPLPPPAIANGRSAPVGERFRRQSRQAPHSVPLKPRHSLNILKRCPRAHSLDEEDWELGTPRDAWHSETEPSSQMDKVMKENLELRRSCKELQNENKILVKSTADLRRKLKEQASLYPEWQH